MQIIQAPPLSGGRVRAAWLAALATAAWPLAAPCAEPDAPPAATAAEAPPHTLTLHGDEAVAMALKVMIANGQADQALDLIAALPPERRSQTDIAMVQAQLLRATGQANRAVDVYRGLLARFPKDQRIRLELAETLFGLKDLRASETYFRMALSGDLPDRDRRLARAYLNQILSQRPWTITGGLGMAPDSNVNGATSAREIQLWGLPFQLSDDARQRSGLNINGYVSGQGSVALAKGARLVGTTWANANENRSRQFSSEAAGLRIGPEFSQADHRWSINATAEQRWYGGDTLYTAAGAAFDAEIARQQGLVVYAGGVSAQRVDDKMVQARDAWLYGLDMQRTRYLSPQRLWRASVGLRLNRARDATESYALGRVSAGLYQTLPLRLGIYIEPSASISRYDAPAFLFGVVREDRSLSLSGRLVKEDYSFRGFAPYVGGDITRTHSTITLYDYTRQRVEFGVTRTF